MLKFNSMKKTLLILILALIFVIGAFYVTSCLPIDRDYKEAINAEIVGSGILGIFLLVVSLFISGVSSKTSKETKEKQVLLNILEEINWNLDRNNERNGSRNDLTQGDYFKDTFWRSVSSSNLISRIDSSELLNAISSAYFAVKIVISIEDQARKHLNSYPSDYALGDAMLPDIKRHRDRMSKNLSAAKEECNTRIEELL